MLQNYIKTAFRQLWRHKLFSALNIFGLATSMAVCLLLIMILVDQYSYDNFHEHKSEIYRVISAKAEQQMPKKASFATTSLAVAEDLREAYPFVESTVRFLQVGKEVMVGEKKFQDEVIAYATDQNFLSVFSFGWTAGDQRTALLNPRSVVLTESTAKRFFPYSDPMGASIEIESIGNFLVTGIIPDPPIRSHINFNYLISYNTLATLSEEERESIQVRDKYHEIWRGLVYLKLDKTATQKQLDNALASIAANYSERDDNYNYLFQSQSLDNVTPSKDLSNEIGMATPSIVLQFLLSLGLIIIFSACFNYTNLSIARSLKRAKEIGVRKAIGARKRDISIQFLGEAILIALIALVVAIGLLELLIPAFLGIDPFVQQVVHLTRSPKLYLIFLGFSLVVGLLAGIFPAFNVAKFQPIQAIQRLENIKLLSKVGIRKALITIQFTLSLLFILAVIIVLKQQKYILNYDYGLQIDNIFNVRLNEIDYDVFAQKVTQIPSVEMVSNAGVVLLSGESKRTTIQFDEGRDSMMLIYNTVSSNYLENLDIPLLAGKPLPETVNSTGEQFILLNEKATKRMGFDSPDKAVGTTVLIDTTALTVTGVTANFQHDNIWFDPVQPFGIRQNIRASSNAVIRVKEGSSATSIAAIQAVWKELAPDKPFVGFFTNERVFYLSRFFKMGAQIIGFVGLLTIIIACLGLLGMVTYTVEDRVKEVGIRKVLGANKKQIIWQLSKSFLWLLLIAIVFAVPLTILGANLWLQNFVQQITISPVIFSTGIGVILLLGLVTVLSQAYWAASSNPVESLRNE